MPTPSHILTLPTLHPHAAELRDAILNKLTYSCSTTPSNAGPYDWYLATVLAVRDRMVDRWLESEQKTERKHSKRVYYLSIEYLIGRLLFDTLINLRLLGTARTALASLDVDLDQLRKLEPDAALGNGGLGRLAACYMDSMAALAVPAYGYGIRYEHGLFMQQIRDGWQQEQPERWLAFGNPWEFERLETEYSIRFGGSVEYIDGGVDGTARGLWYPAERVLAVAHDTPITGWRGRHVNTLRLWSARSTTPTLSAQRPHGCRPRRFHGCSIRATPHRPARSCACGRSTFSLRHRCRTSSGVICSISTICIRSPSTSPFSSTTRTRRSLSRN
jgi:starch phosphorylase